MNPQQKDDVIQESVHQLTEELSPLQRLIIVEAMTPVLRQTTFSEEEWSEFSKTGQVPKKVFLQLAINLAREIAEHGRDYQRNGPDVRTLGWALNLAAAHEVLEWLRKSQKDEASFKEVVAQLMKLRDKLYPEF